MRVGIISDLHLAPGDENRCTATDDEVLRLFDTIERECDEIVIAGDLFDLSRPHRLLDWRGQLDAIFEDHRQLVERLEAHRWVWGNHDRWLARCGHPERITYTGDLTLVIQHGHQYDVGLKRVPGLETSANWVAGWLVRSGIEPAAKAIGAVPEVMERLVEGHGAPLAESLEARGAREIIARGDADIVAMGHSHRLASAHFGTSLFVNTGSLSDGHLDWVCVDTQTGRTELHRDDRTIVTKEISR